MSKVLKAIKPREIGHIVQTEDGKTYYVDSCYTTDHGLETMVFAFNLEADEVSDWMDLYAEWYDSVDEMVKRHEEICLNLEKYLGNGQDESKRLLVE